MQTLEKTLEENGLAYAPQPEIQKSSDKKQHMLDDQKSDIVDDKAPQIYNDQEPRGNEELPEKQDEQQEHQGPEEQQPLIENEQRLEILKEQLPQAQDEQQQIRDEQLPERQNEQQEQQPRVNEQLKSRSDEQKEQPILNEIRQSPLAAEQQQQQQMRDEQLLERQNEQQEQQPRVDEQLKSRSDEQPEQPILNEVRQSPLAAQQPQMRDEQLSERQNEQQEQQPRVDEQLKPRSDEQEEQPIPNEIRQSPLAAQQIPLVPERQRRAGQNEGEQEQQIPDEVRQMRDAQQQMLREIQKMFKQSEKSSNNKMFLLSVLFVFVLVIVALFQKSPMDYVDRKEFEAFKTDSQTGLIAVRKVSQESISEHQARIAKFGKHLEDFMMNMTKTNPTGAKELPNYSIENLLEASRKTNSDISKLQAEILDLHDKNLRLQKALNGFEARLQKMENEMKLDTGLGASTKYIFLVVICVALLKFILVCFKSGKGRNELNTSSAPFRRTQYY